MAETSSPGEIQDENAEARQAQTKLQRKMDTFVRQVFTLNHKWRHVSIRDDSCSCDTDCVTRHHTVFVSFRVEEDFEECDEFEVFCIEFKDETLCFGFGTLNSQFEVPDFTFTSSVLGFYEGLMIVLDTLFFIRTQSFETMEIEMEAESPLRDILDEFSPRERHRWHRSSFQKVSWILPEQELGEDYEYDEILLTLPAKCLHLFTDSDFIRNELNIEANLQKSKNQEMLESFNGVRLKKFVLDETEGVISFKSIVEFLKNNDVSEMANFFPVIDIGNAEESRAVFKDLIENVMMKKRLDNVFICTVECHHTVLPAFKAVFQEYFEVLEGNRIVHAARHYRWAFSDGTVCVRYPLHEQTSKITISFMSQNEAIRIEDIPLNPY